MRTPEASKLPPGPEGRRFRNLRKRFRDTAGLFEELHARHGSIVRYDLPGRRFYAVSDAELIREILLVKRASFEKSDVGKGTMRCPTILTGDGDEHRRRRRLMQPSFSRAQANWFGEVVIRHAAARQRRYSPGHTVDLREEMHGLALDIACEAFFGDDSPADPALVDALLKALKWKVMRGLLPMGTAIAHLPLPANRRTRRTIARMDDVVDKAIGEARRTRPGVRFDVVSVLVHAKDEDGVASSFTDEEVREDAYVLLLAGHETCANALTWSFSEVLRRPEIRSRLEAELDDIIGEAPVRVEDVDRLPYTRAVFNETLRMMPPVHYVSRRAIEDCRIGGYFVPRDTVMQCAIRMLHMDDRHFPQPLEFRPERWLDAGTGHPRHAYIPFGWGPRICIGRELALIQGPLVLASFLKDRRFSPARPKDVDEATSMVLYMYRNPLIATVRDRRRSSE